MKKYIILSWLVFAFTFILTTSNTNAASQEAVQWATSKGIIQPNENLDVQLTEGEYAILLQKRFELPAIKQQIAKRDSQATHVADDAYNRIAPYRVSLNGYLHNYMRDDLVKKGLVIQSLTYFSNYAVSLDDLIMNLVEEELIEQQDAKSTNPIKKSEVIELFYKLRYWNDSSFNTAYNDETSNVTAFAKKGVSRVNKLFQFDMTTLLKNELKKVPAPKIPAASANFQQGAGFEQGAYDTKAILPTSTNWNKNSRYQGPTKKPKKIWSVTSRHYVDSGIVIAKDGTMYFANLEGDLTAINKNGKQVWRFTLPNESTSRSHPVIGKDGTIYYTAFNFNLTNNKKLKYFCKNNQCEDSVLFAITPKGKLKWFVRLKYANDNGSPAIDKNGNIYVATASRKYFVGQENVPTYYKVSAAGKLLSATILPSGELPNTTPILSKSGRHFLQNELFDGKKFSLNTWQAGVDSNLWSTPTVDSNGNFYYGTYYGSLVYLANDGSTSLSLQLEPKDTKDERISSTPVITKNDRIQVGSKSGVFYSIPRKNLASYSEDPSSTVVEKRFVFDAKKSLDAWTYKMDGKVDTLTAGRDGILYAATDNGTIYALSATGKLLWKTSVGKGYTIHDLAISNNKNLIALVSGGNNQGFLMAFK